MNLLFPFVVLVVTVAATLVLGGSGKALAVAILVVLEVSLSFDNAVINATILRRLNRFWRQLFLTVGLLVAVVGMRLLFPIVIIAATAGIGLGRVVDLALHRPELYGEKLAAAHPAIAAFGGIFLFMVFLDFLIDESKQVHWLTGVERALARAGRLKTLSSLVALVALTAVSLTWAGPDAGRVLVAGLAGLATYLVTRSLSVVLEKASGASGKSRRAGGTLVGRAALASFVYLEVLDASFSFDGVVGAFAVSNDVLVIAAGLGIGALFIRELTVWLVERDALRKFVYLEHGAHYAVGSLAVLLAVSLAYNVPEVVTGLAGAGFIGLALGSSVAERRRSPKTSIDPSRR